ncbi:hypothetical protein HUU05_08710 [candidate division KSB1 bacterium]|nr:hypothetical protein [candidate division KSB1 bacterium]
MFKSTLLSSSTTDLSKFDDVTLEAATDLLKAYLLQKHHAAFLRNGVRLYFNQESNLVFLADDKLRIGVSNHGELREWVSCRVCGAEGFGDEGEICEELCQSCAQRTA